MTREEAINIMLQMIKDEEEFLSDDTVEAHKMAIQALSQEGGYCCRTCKHTRINKDGIWCEEPTCQWEQAVTNSEAQEPCDDLISREAVINTLDNIDKALDEDKTVKNYKALLKECYEVLPSVTQKSETVTEFADRCRECGARYCKLLKQKTGHWIYDETIENWRCSKCNETPKTMGYVGTADFMAEHFKFCNHCGAKMVEPQESEE